MGKRYEHANGSFEVISAVCPKCGGDDWYGVGSMTPKILCRKCDIKMNVKIAKNRSNARGAGVTVLLLVAFSVIAIVVLFLASL